MKGPPLVAQPDNTPDHNTPGHNTPDHNSLDPVPRHGGGKPGSPSTADSPNSPSSLFVRRLALSAFEVLDGVRGIEQLAPWVTRDVLGSLATQRTLRAERNTVYRDRRRVVANPGRVHLSKPVAHAAECVVVMHTTHRSFPVPMRLELIRGKWRATSLHIL